MSTKAEFKVMTRVSSKMLWLHSLYIEVGFSFLSPMPMFYGNHAAIFIANDRTFYECTKHIEIDYHAISHWINSGIISTPHEGSSNRLADILTKGLSIQFFDTFCTWWPIQTLHSSLRGSVMAVL